MPSPTVVLLSALGLLGTGAGCSSEARIVVAVVAPDGGDPFYGSDSATHARVYLENTALNQYPDPIRVEPGGGFRAELFPVRNRGVSRLRIDALRNGEVVASGATPRVDWQQLGDRVASVLMQYPDSIVPAPVTLRSPRAGFRLVPLGTSYVVALTAPSMTEAGLVPDVYDLLFNGGQTYFQAVPAEFDEHTAVLTVYRAWLLINGTRHALFTSGVDQPVDMERGAPPSGRAGLTDSTVVDDITSTDGGGWLVGGRDPQSGEQSRHVDHVSGKLAWDISPAPVDLNHARIAPAVIALGESLSPSAGLWLIVGGQSLQDPLLEVYAPGSSNPPIDLATEPAVNNRRDVATACIARDDRGCTYALILGGKRADGSLVDDDLVLDGHCARRRGTDCVTSVSILMPRRWGVRATLAEGGRVLVVGGHTVGGAAVVRAEIIDVSDPVRPRPLGPIGPEINADPAVLSVSNGSVMIAGGRHRDGTAGNEIWFYRH